ncbi:MAG: hypothetical protein DSY90_04205 [Deltaproteobacteria bacterium]|nr:MAG: hypothetical protein DSY90_04205 [Deltaproteobacteria bacterium]
MKKKKLFSIIIVTALSLALIVPAASAGSRHRRHRDMLRGAAIGIGAFMIGSAIHNRIHRRAAAHLPYYRYEPPPPRQCGHWETRRVWVPPTYRRVWNPGHYDHRNCWIPGSYIDIVDRDGYWDEQQTWKASR